MDGVGDTGISGLLCFVSPERIQYGYQAAAIPELDIPVIVAVAWGFTMKFSVITASFHSGEKLWTTIRSILEQDFQDYEVVIKDGGSKDHSVEKLQGKEQVRHAVSEGRLICLVCPDKGVYDGMNQALSVCQGDYVLFLNCGDVFHDRKVLERAAEEIEKQGVGTGTGAVKKADQDGAEPGRKAGEGSRQRKPAVFYGNTFCKRTGAIVHSSPQITGFTCYRNIPCHQSCFYDRRLFQEKKYDTGLKIRADYDHFLWCYYKGKAKFHYMDLIVSDYEGGGISESEENRKTDKAEHELIIKRYMSGGEILKYKTMMALTLAPLRRWIAESSSLSGAYHKMKMMLYRFRRI